MFALGTVALLTLSSVAASDSDEDLEGLPIVRIVFDRSNIFDTADPKTSAWFYRWANALHIVTKERFLRQMVLFKEGDPYSPKIAEESARLIRQMGFINPVYITARRAEGGVEVTVATRDQWTLQVGGSFGLAGERRKWSIEFQEENFLGWGKKLDLQFRSDVERDTWAYRYRDPNILGTRWKADLIYEDSSDGSLQQVLLERPFFSLATDRAWGGRWLAGDLIEHLYSESDSVVSGRHESDVWGAWYGIRLPIDTDVTRRLNIGWDYQRHTYREWEKDDGSFQPTPEDRAISGPRITYQQVRDRFVVMTGFRGWTAQEDVALGPNLALGMTVSLPELGGDVTRLLTDGSLTTVWRSGNWMITGDSWFRGRLDGSDPRNWVVGIQAAASQIGTRGLQARIFIEGSHELDLDQQLTLGADVGLRGWDPDYFDGTGRAVANLQWRTLLKRDLFQLFSLGFLVFGDAGVTWDPRVGPGTDGVRADIGAGLLFDLTTFGRADVLRVEVGWPDDNTGATLLVTASSLF
jgi:NOL1/NOP2/fmu family ribosome biogenesis protein